MHNIVRRLFIALGLLLVTAGGLPRAADALPPPPPPGATVPVQQGNGGRLIATTACGVFEQTADETAWHKVPGIDGRVLDIANERVAIALVTDGQGGLQPALFRREPGGAWERQMQAPATPLSLAVS